VSAWTDDSLFVGRLMVERLCEKVPALRSVELLDELDDRETEPKQTPAAVVILDFLQPLSIEPVREQIPVEQLWLVMLVTHSKRRAPDRIATEVGPLIPACISALHGWMPKGCTRPLGWVRGGPRPSYAPKTNLHPLLFRAQLLHGGS
jgi:hypothetical protein